ncbi:uncharacterized protein [Procambarus clarkii]|uniref:uncharacterized protein n=1 Tax=Procambarus clarkii TaxID=6728 RepID=UPI001E671DFB|nr:uncharacterized protein LOC123767242 [Procambarus clarkii]
MCLKSILYSALLASVASVMAQNYHQDNQNYHQDNQNYPQLDQAYQTPRVVKPDYGQPSSNNGNVANILKEVGDFFKLVGSGDSKDPERAKQVMLAFVPFTRRVLEASAGVDGANVNKEDLERLGAAEAVMPSVITFLDSLRNINPGTNQYYQQDYGHRYQ